jgi:dTDP-glucose pyrophosphorylase
MNILIPAAGKGSRFIKSHSVPKPCIKIENEYMLVKAAKTLGFAGQYIFIIRENEYRDSLAKILYEEFPTCKIAVIDFDTEGAAETALVAESLIDNDDELIIANCDQIMNGGIWDVDLAIKQLRKYDAGLVTIESSDPKHSYAKVEYNVVTEVQEKNVISDVALTGIHYWKQGREFVRSAKKMISKNLSANGEYYIAPTYNELILDNKKVGIHMISKEAINFVGTPNDLEMYESRKYK